MGLSVSVVPRIDYCFAFDELPPEYVKEMKAIALVISFQDYADINYPLKEIIKQFKTEYFVNTVCYMVAYAIYIGTKSLALYGCDDFAGAMWQRECKGLEYWLGRAEERGVNLIIPKKSGILRSLQGRVYHKNRREVLLTLAERLALVKILPENASYDDMLHSETLKWILMPKGDEIDRYNIHFGYDTHGQYTAVCGEEFRVDIPMSEEVYNYLRQRMAEYEKDFGISSGMLSVYEILMTSEWRDGEYKHLKG